MESSELISDIDFCVFVCMMLFPFLWIALLLELKLVFTRFLMLLIQKLHLYLLTTKYCFSCLQFCIIENRCLFATAFVLKLSGYSYLTSEIYIVDGLAPQPSLPYAAHHVESLYSLRTKWTEGNGGKTERGSWASTLMNRVLDFWLTRFTALQNS